jgi:hypothetical protein
MYILSHSAILIIKKITMKKELLFKTRSYTITSLTSPVRIEKLRLGAQKVLAI